MSELAPMNTTVINVVSNMTFGPPGSRSWRVSFVRPGRVARAKPWWPPREINQLGSRGARGIRSLSGRVPRLGHATQHTHAKCVQLFAGRLALFLPLLSVMTVTDAFRLKVLGGTLLGVLVAITAVTFVSARREAPSSVAQPQPAETVSAAGAPPETESPAPVASRSRGQAEWTFFFRPGDTLSRMADGSPLGVVARLERQHKFPDGSTGPAYVIRSADQQESAFDADELERRARIEAIRDVRIPPTR
jgi:hypothetical protein